MCVKAVSRSLITIKEEDGDLICIFQRGEVLEYRLYDRIGFDMNKYTLYFKDGTTRVVEGDNLIYALKSAGILNPETIEIVVPGKEGDKTIVWIEGKWTKQKKESNK
jgi:hypothetical protein